MSAHAGALWRDANSADMARHGRDALGTDAPAALATLRAFHLLDALRGLAAIVVVLVHAGFVYSLARPPQGYLAVDLFFVMSGFIIAHRYDRDLAAGMGVRRFMSVRLIRLYPLFLLGTLVGALPSVLTLLAQGPNSFHEAMLASLPQALLMLPSWFVWPQSNVLYPLNFVSWSLALEIVVNLVYVATFRFCTMATLLAVAALAFVGLCACAATWGTLEVGFEWPHAIGGFARIFYGFAIGVLIQRLYARGVRVPRLPWWLPLAAALALFFLPSLEDHIVWQLAACTLAVPLIVAAAVTSEPPQRLRGLCAIAGVFSYVLYSLHIPLIGLFLRIETRVQGSAITQTPGDAIAFTVLLALACVAAHVVYDKPVRRALSRWLRPPGAPARNPPGRVSAGA